MRTKWLVVPLMVMAACGSEGQSGDQEPTSGTTTDVAIVAPVSTTDAVPLPTDTVPRTTGAILSVSSTTLGPVTQEVSVEGPLPEFDGPATLWRIPAMPPDPERLSRWALVFGFTEDEIATATEGRIARDAPDGQLLAISEPAGRWDFINGPAGMYAAPGTCPLPVVAPSPTVAPAPTLSLPPGQGCNDPPPPGVPEPAAAETQARSLWDALGIDVSGAVVTVGGDEYLREVIASDDLGDVTATRLRVVIGEGGRVLRATGSLDPAVAAGSAPRVSLEEALDRFAHEPPSAGPVAVPPPIDGVYRVIGATAGLISSGGSWLIPTYEVSLADGRTMTLLAIDQSDIPID